MPTTPRPSTPILDIPAILSGLQDQIDELTRIVQEQQTTIEQLRGTLRQWASPEA